MIIGLTGLYCSGKDTAAEYFVTKGFTHISLSDLLREEMKKRKIEITRDNLIQFANDLRRLLGPGVLADMAIRQIEPGKNFVVSSIRSPAEVEALKKTGTFLLIEIQSSAQMRFKRLLKRKRENDPTTLKQMLAKEEQEKSSNPLEQQIHKVIKMAKVKILNDSTVMDLHKKLDSVIDKWQHEFSHRPSWDQYFIGVSREVASRATCDRGRSGCIIVKDKRILTTGYVGSPIGVAHCDEVGHQMHSVINTDGTTSKHCIRTTHAEQNAIVQAARYGIAINGATVYCKMEPCYVCAKMIVNAGIKRVVCEKQYHGAKLTRDLFKKAEIQLDVLSEELEKYANQSGESKQS
ncbi:MAG: AAA family ATPase [Planctomycetes bacterium]|nr:AAA family ATPase [Planctomycetota bacterium]